MHKKLISTIALGLIVGATTVNSFAANTEFTDISGHWGESQIQAFVNKGYINGYPDGTFKPNKSITRAEAVSTLSRVNNDKLNSIVVNSIKELQKALLDKNIGTIENIYVPKNKTLTIKSELDIYTANIDGNLNLDNCGATNFYKDVNINGNLNVFYRIVY